MKEDITKKHVGRKEDGGRPLKTLNLKPVEEIYELSLDNYDSILAFLNFLKNKGISGEISPSQIRAMAYVAQIASRIIPIKEELNITIKKLKEFDKQLKIIEARSGREDNSSTRKTPKEVKWQKPPTPEENSVSNLVRKYMKS